MEPAAWGLIGNQRPSPILIDFDRFDIVPAWGLPGADRVGQPAVAQMRGVLNSNHSPSSAQAATSDDDTCVKNESLGRIGKAIHQPGCVWRVHCTQTVPMRLAGDVQQQVAV